MNKIDKLLVEFCSEGVEYLPLWSVTAWDKKFNAVDKSMQKKIYKYPVLLAKDLFSMQQESGDVFLLSTGTETGWTTEEIAGEYICEGEVVTLPWGKSSPVKGLIKYFKGKFVTGDNRIATSLDTTKLLNKYLYYWMINQGDTIDTCYRGSGIKHPSMFHVLTMQIPIPPLHVQREIVHVLDSFTLLTAELTAELTARKKQYEYYRNNLLTFDNVKTKYYTLKDICEIVDYRGKTPKKVENGVFLVTAKNIRQGYIDYEKSKEYISKDEYMEVMHRGLPQIGDVLITTEAPCGNVAMIDREDIALAQRVIKYRPKDYKFLDSGYLKHILLGKEFQEKLAKSSTGGTVKGIKGSKLHQLTIPVPPLDVQKRIANVLDNFDTICTDLNIGLPAEIEARKKQYEYYRDKLLTFKELSK